MECYVLFSDCKNNYRESKKDFKDFKTAWEWVIKTFDTPNKDFIHYY